MFSATFSHAYLRPYSLLPSVASMQQIVTSGRMETPNKQRKLYIFNTLSCVFFRLLRVFWKFQLAIWQIYGNPAFSLNA